MQTNEAFEPYELNAGESLAAYLQRQQAERWGIDLYHNPLEEHGASVRVGPPANPKETA